MKHSDFSIGLDFFSSGGFPYRCTDVGKRTITAISLKNLDKSWFEGPPYAVAEETFDEMDIASSFLTNDAAIEDAIGAYERGITPSYPHEAVMVFVSAWSTPDYRAYPNKPLLRMVKVLNGNIYKAYGVRQDGDTWTVLCFCLFDNEFVELPESQFLECQIATEADYLAKRARL